MLSPLKYKELLGEALRTIADTRHVLTKIQESQRRLHARQSRLLRRQTDLQHQVTDLRIALHDEIVSAQDALAMQHEIAATNTAAFDEYKDAFRGRDVVVVASGATLEYYDPIPDAVHIGVNSVIRNDRIPHDIHFAQDFGGGGGFEHVLKLYDDGGVPPECKLFFGLLAHAPNGQMEPSESITARLGATRYFVNPGITRIIQRDIRFHPLMDFYTVVFPALHFALFTNPRRVYLAGCDASYFGYFDGTPQIGSEEQIREYLANRLIGYRRVREFARTWYTETEIISVNPVNLAGLFTDVSTTDADYRRSPHQAALAEADYSDEAIHEFVEWHIREVRGSGQ